MRRLLFEVSTKLSVDDVKVNVSQHHAPVEDGSMALGEPWDRDKIENALSLGRRTSSNLDPMHSLPLDCVFLSR